MWMFNHALTGVIAAQIARTFDLSLLAVFFIALIVMVDWEVHERSADVKEPWQNSIIDVIVGVGGFFAMRLLVPMFSNTVEIVVLIILILLSGVLNWWGWDSWNKRRKNRRGG